MVKDKQVCKQNGQEYYVVDADRLKAMFEAQKALSKRMGLDFKSMTMAQREESIKEDAVFMMIELSELLSRTNWKDCNKEKAVFELEQAEFKVVDLWAFLMRTAMHLGMDDEDFFQRYMRKVEINYDR